MKSKGIWGFAVLIFLLMAGCNQQSDRQDVPEPPSQTQSQPEEQSAAANPDDMEHASAFLETAHAMGYTDTQLEILFNCEVPEDVILGLTNREPDNSFYVGETADGRYRLDGYTVTGILGCMYILDQQTGQATILPDWQTGYNLFGIIDDETFFVSVSQVGGADYEAGIRIYCFEQPAEPSIAWNLTDSSVETATTKILLETYHKAQEKVFVVFWCEIPVDSWEWGEETTETYQATAIGYDGTEIGTFDTGIQLKNGKTGISTPNTGKANTSMEPMGDCIYFEFDDIIYRLNYITGEVGEQ